ncbi:NADPH-dependent F420 reductase [Pyxidicoccus sp. QH1ED-7-1]|nr:NADPH-dependent F420 reductase [Pyxidicoccus xibeiensis]
MVVGIIGAGSIGQALAGHMVRAGHEVIVSNSRGPESLAGLVRQLGPRTRAGTRQEAAKADIVVLSVPWEQVPGALADLPPWNGRILIDATNPVLLPGFRLADLGGRTSSEVVASLAPGARVVKAANTLLAAVLAVDPRQAGGRRVLFMSGNDADAMTEAGRLFGQLGFATVDLGPLATGGRLQQFPGGPLATLNLIKLD